MCSRWSSSTCFTSGLYSTENSGGSESGSDSEEIGVGSPLESVIGASGVVKEIPGMELSIAELTEPVLSIGDVNGVAAF